MACLRILYCSLSVAPLRLCRLCVQLAGFVSCCLCAYRRRSAANSRARLPRALLTRFHERASHGRASNHKKEMGGEIRQIRLCAAAAEPDD